MKRLICVVLLSLWVGSSLSSLALAHATPTPAPTAPEEPIQFVIVARVLHGANVRSGPGTQFARVGGRPAGALVTLVRTNEAGDWYQLDTGQWIAAFLVQPVVPTPVPTATTPATVTLVVGSWNVESGGAAPPVVGERLAAFEGVDLWGLSEVANDAAAAILENAAEVGGGANFERIVSNSGRSDRLVILYNGDRFEASAADELEYINIGGTVRAPLLVPLRDRESGQSLVLMVNHLNRGNPSRRHDQAALLNEWAITDDRPAIAVGDYNFDWDVVDGDTNHDLGYDFMTAQGEWVWVRPAALHTTQCEDWPCRFNSVLDFVFSANGAQQWPARAEIVVVDGDFPDDANTSDHRPLLAWFELPVVGEVTVTPNPTITETVHPTVTPTPPPVGTGDVRIVAVNKQEEYVDLENGGSSAIDLAGWVLRSERGLQDCTLAGRMEPGERLRVWAMAGPDGFSCGYTSPIWSNSTRDPAVLLDASGSEVSRFE